MSEQYILEIGDSFTASQLATHSGTFKVKDRYEQAGFCYYVSENNIVFRNKDVDQSTIQKQIKKSYLFSYISDGFRRYETYKHSDMETLFESKKEETKSHRPDARAFFICSDQDSEEVEESWGKLTKSNSF